MKLLSFEEFESANNPLIKVH